MHGPACIFWAIRTPFARQALVGGNYGLLQEHTYEPNPDLYLAIVWKRLMGREVLNATVAAAVGDIGGELHVYAHCEPARHAVRRREQQIGGSGGSIEPPGPLS